MCVIKVSDRSFRGRQGSVVAGDGNARRQQIEKEGEIF
jgi:hypothetical protein